MSVRVLFLATVAATLAAVTSAPEASAPSPRLDAAMRAFWNADDVGELERAAREVVASGASVDEIRARLKAGRTYERARTGRVEMRTVDHGVSLDNVVEIPESYDRSRAWPLRVTLHGGVGREAPAPGAPPGRPLANRIPGSPEIVLHPRAWSMSEWWKTGQVQNIVRLLDRVSLRVELVAELVDEAFPQSVRDGHAPRRRLDLRRHEPRIDAKCPDLAAHLERRGLIDGPGLRTSRRSEHVRSAGKETLAVPRRVAPEIQSPAGPRA